MRQNQSEPGIGSVITIYDFERRKFVVTNIYKGGMGIVYQLLPVDPFETAVALKTYQHHVSVEQFINEARIWFSLSGHPNIATAFWYGLWYEIPSILAEWYLSSVKNISISTWKVPDIKQFVVNVIEGLSYAYETFGVIHQDIKPDNILVDKSQNPRISDFGVSVLFHERQKIVAGTRGYMAPELLFAGSEPSVKTDIFSLGVTIYELLTGKKAEINPEVQGDSRKKDLIRVRKRFGKEIQPILDITEAAYQLSPRDRASSYKELLKVIGRTESNKLIYKKSDKDTVAEASLLTKRGEIQEAIGKLQKFLAIEPENPLVLNSLGCCYLRIENRQQAIVQFEKASNLLESKSGMHNNRIYPDPIVNLANIYIDTGNYSNAFRLLGLAWSWGQQDNLGIRYYYSEFGWYLLYKGDFYQSCQQILSSYRTMSPDNKSIKCLVLSAYLTGNFDQWVKKFYGILMSLSVFDTGTALLAILVANYLNPQERKVLHQKALGDCLQELTNIADEIGVSLAFERFPLHPKVVRMIILSLDTVTTGGKFNELLRQSFQPSLGKNIKAS